MRLLVCLREPVDRAFSDYLDLVKNGQCRRLVRERARAVSPPRRPRPIRDHLRRYLDLFPREQLLVQLFDDLRQDAQGYADEVFAFLGVSRLELPPAALKSRMPAGRAAHTPGRRAQAASRLVRRSACDDCAPV